MRYSIFLFICCLGLSQQLQACMKHDASYYATHPSALKEAIQHCPDKSPKHVSCATLRDIAIELNELVYELRMSPQIFGNSILALQETIAKDETALDKQRKNADLIASIDKNKKLLGQKMAIVGWLESPER